MVEKFPSTGLSTVNSIVFSHAELRQVLTAYSQGVLTKNWKDYAIHSDKDQTTFCVVERGQGTPMAVIYSISRTRSRKNNGNDFYRVYDGEQQIHRSESFLEALNVFQEVGRPGQKKNKKIKIIK